ncbi:hypothetical protein FQR65_LT16107 [Abscondita terminalis]|nr:hypothetical protein FQR65_LT16107 [Abscondita terminalis]
MIVPSSAKWFRIIDENKLEITTKNLYTNALRYFKKQYSANKIPEVCQEDSLENASESEAISSLSESDGTRHLASGLSYFHQMEESKNKSEQEFSHEVNNPMETESLVAEVDDKAITFDHNIGLHN